MADAPKGLWSKAFRSLRLPTGETTEDPKEYEAQWNELISFAESMFPGYRVFGFDPDLILSHPQGNSSMNISVHALSCLKEAVDALPPRKPRRKPK